MAHRPGRPLLQQPPPLERRSVHGLHGHPPVGQVLDGGVAGPARADLGHRRRGVRGVGRRVLHRLPVPAELRLPVDLHQRQGRLQRRRRRRLLQPHELRPDADVAHRADPARARRPGRRPRAGGAGARRRPPPPGPQRARGRAARRAAAAADRADWRGRPAATTSSRKPRSPPWSPSSSSSPWPACCRRPTIPPVTVATWAKIAPADFVATAASELAGTSETATYGPPYNSATGAPQRLLFSPDDHRRGPPADRRGQTFVLSPAGEGRPHRSGARRRARPLQRCLGRHPERRGTPPTRKAVTKVTFHDGAAVVPRGRRRAGTGA